MHSPSNNPTLTPNHVAVILDGNNRWQQSHPNSKHESGHVAGVHAVGNLITNVLKHNIRYLTIFAFSTENWHRSKEEVSYLAVLFNKVVTDTKNISDMQKNGIQFKFIGDIKPFDKVCNDLSANFNNLVQATSTNNKMTLTIAINYGGRWDITEASKKISQACLSQDIDIADIDEKLFNSFLSTQNIPDPDLLIRTSNENRISNFLLWQCAYSELYFTDVLWPDFDEKCLLEAIKSYQKRQRRFGKRI